MAKDSTHKHQPLSSMPRTHVKWQGVVAQVCNHSAVEVKVGRSCHSLASQPHRTDTDNGVSTPEADLWSTLTHTKQILRSNPQSESDPAQSSSSPWLFPHSPAAWPWSLSSFLLLLLAGPTLLLRLHALLHKFSPSTWGAEL